MYRIYFARSLLAGMLLVLSGCQAGEEAPADNPDEQPSALAAEAVSDLADRLGLSAGDVRLVSEEAVTWRDGSLGCPQKGMMYTQALAPGTLIVLAVGDREYRYHAGEGRGAFYCSNPQSPLDVNPAQ